MNWSVVATVKADKELIDLFVDHYIKIGASEIFLYLDDPKDKYIQEFYINNPKVTTYLCDTGFWGLAKQFKNFGFTSSRPDGVEDRQCHNLAHALSKAKTKWLACIDIDEFIYSSKNITTVLESIPDNIYSIRMKPFEATYLNSAPKSYKAVIETKYFKHSTKRSDVFFWNEIIPSGLIHKAGLFGHISGKCFLRTDEPIKWLGLHNPKPLDIDLISGFRIDDLKLLHFEALTVDFFTTKTLNRLNKSFNVKTLDPPSVTRLENLQKIYDQNGIAGLQNAYDDMHVLGLNEITKGINLHVIDEIDIDYINKPYKTILVTVHKTFLVFNTDANMCQLHPISEIKDLPKHLKIVEIACDIEQNMCYLFTTINNKITYLFSDKHGVLVSYPHNKAMIFKCVSQNPINLQVSIMYCNGQHFTARLDKSFRLGPQEAQAWESFNIKNICFSD